MGAAGMAKQLETTGADVVTQLDKAGNASNLLSMILRGHYSVEHLINLSFHHFLGSKIKSLIKMSFAQKLDLLEGIGILPQTNMPIYRSFNALRNRFAHNPYARFTKKDRVDMTNSLRGDQLSLLNTGLKVSNTTLPDATHREFIRNLLLMMGAELMFSIERTVRVDVGERFVKQKLGQLVEIIGTRAQSNAAYDGALEAEVKKIVDFKF
jgi:hypothetical protein